MISILSMITQKNIVRSRDHVSIELDVTGAIITTNLSKCKNRSRKIKSGIAGLLGINANLVEILRPKQIQNGLKLHINVLVSNSTSIDMNISELLQKAKESGVLVETVREAWSLNSVPMIGNVKVNQFASKQRRDGEVVIKAMLQPIDSGSNNIDVHNDIAMVELENTDLKNGYIANKLDMQPVISPVVTAGYDQEEYSKESDERVTLGNEGD